MSDSTPTPSKPPHRSVAWWKLLIGLAVAVAVLILGVVLSGPIRAGTTALLGSDDHEHAEDEGWWTCGMHPWVVLPSPEGGCPICGMDLVPLDTAKFAGELTIDPVMVQNIGVRIGEVTKGPLVREVRTVGSVEVDETRVADVNTRFSGFIEELFVDETGEKVEAGEPMFSVYSPELYAAADEYRLAVENAERGGKVQQDIVDAAERRLQLLGLTDDEIGRLSDEEGETITVRSPTSGTVLDKMAVAGMRIEPGMRMYRIADLSNLYVQATVYEDDLPLVNVGMQAVVTLPNFPGVEVEGTVTFISPTVDATSRQGRVRVEIDSDAGRIKPGMFAQVTLLHENDRPVVLAPREAILMTGRRDIAMISLGEGKFEPRDVTVGRDAVDGQVEILEGLEPGEMIVTSGQFLLDSEARTREALAKMLAGDDMAADQQAAVETAAVGASELSADEAEAVSALLRAYLPMSDLLSRDRTDGLAAMADDVAAAAPNLAGPARAVASAGNDLDAARAAFAKLSTRVSDRVMQTGVPATLDIEVARLRCPMFPPGEKSPWLQTAGEPRNPYYGSAMLVCFDERALIPATPVDGASPATQPASDETVAEATDVEPIAAMPAEMAAALTDVLRAYLVAAAPALAEAAGRLAAEAPTLDAEALADAAARLDTDDLSDARLAFKAVSDVLYPLVADVGVPLTLDAELIAARCPMFPMGEKSWWIQPEGDLRNPYYGSAMLACSDEQVDLPTVRVAAATPTTEGAD
ncbi:MAG: efflux RND transporter periplasmic adaptor subunit [Planctomycetota bacterium]